MIAAARWGLSLGCVIVAATAAADALFAPLTLGLVAIAATHGATDHLIAGLSRRAIGPFIVAYLGLAGVVALGWILAPGLTLGLFVLGSMWHFGRTDLQGASAAPALWMTRGAVVLLVPLCVHAAAIAPIVAALGVEIALPAWLPAPIWAAHLIAAVVCLPGRRAALEALDVLLLALVACTLPPLLAFALYFALWHSPQHWRDVAPLLRASPAWARWAAVAFGGVGAMVVLVAGAVVDGVSGQSWAVIFATLAMVTLPHGWLVERWHRAQVGAPRGGASPKPSAPGVAAQRG